MQLKGYTSESLRSRDACLCGDPLVPPSELPTLIHVPDASSPPVSALEPLCVCMYVGEGKITTVKSLLRSWRYNGAPL